MWLVRSFTGWLWAWLCNMTGEETLFSTRSRGLGPWLRKLFVLVLFAAVARAVMMLTSY